MILRQAAGSSSSLSYQLHHSFAELIPLYDAFILDQFGVLHNGATALDGAVDCLNELYQNQKKLIILSNTSGPAKSALEKLPKYGFDRNHFLGAVTSGEEASKYIKKVYGSCQSTEKAPPKALWLTWDASGNTGGTTNLPNPNDFLSKCGNIQVADTVDEADFVLCHGAHVWQRSEAKSVVSLGSFLTTGSTEEVIDPILEECKERDLPMVCANPDLVVKLPSGETGHMPGKIAKRYQELGGKCTSFGKPHKEHFVACLEALEPIPRDRVCHVGDSLHHDIAGANAAGIASAFITSGIHCDDLAQSTDSFGVLPHVDLIDALLEKEGVVPTHILSAFRM